MEHIKNIMRFASLSQPLMPTKATAQGHLHEVHAAAADWAAATSFALTMLGQTDGAKPEGAVLIIRVVRRSLPALLFGAGLAGLGIAPQRLLLAQARNALEMLRAGVEAARCQDVSAVLLEIWGRCPEWDLTASRRLALAAEKSGVSVLVLRGDADEQPSSAQTRWRVTSAPSIALAANAPGLPSIDAELLRQRGGPAGTRVRLEWDEKHGNFRPTANPATNDQAALSGAVVPLSGLRAGAAALSPAIPQAA